MKTGVICDLHYGARGDSPAVLDHQAKVVRECIIPTLKARSIKTLFILGDLVDRRKYINFLTAKRLRTEFIEPILAAGIEIVVIPGNHDVYHKDNNDTNALDELLSRYPGIRVIHRPSEISIDESGQLEASKERSGRVLLMPWMCASNESECLESIKTAHSRILMGHFEIQGFEVTKGVFCESGHSPDIFSGYDLVLSGHFHRRSKYQNINYLGSPWQATWDDFGQTKGFHVLDIETKELEFVPNPFELFHKIKYDDENKTFEELMEFDFQKYKDTFVKVIVVHKSNPFLYDSFIQKLEDAGTLSVKAVEDHLNLDMSVDNVIIEQAETTLDILKSSVQNSGLAKDVERPLISLFQELYQEAISRNED